MQNKIKTKVFAVIGLSVLGGVFLMHSDSVSAYSLTVTTSGSVTADVIPSADGGIGTTIVTDNVGIVSNCRAGYTMTIAGPSDNNLYLNGDDTNNTTGTYFTPVDGTSALNASANANKWGYSLTANSRTGVFTALSSTAATLKTPSQTASPNNDINTTISVYYGTSVNNNMAPGNYTFSNSNSVTYSVVMDTSCTMYSIQYDGSNPDNPNGMGTTDSSTGVKSVKQINIAEDTKVTLLASNFKKAGYGFLGWSTDNDAYTHFTDNDVTNDPIIYGPMEDVIVDSDLMATADNRNIITMYAVWMPALKDGSNNTVYFQDWDNPNTNLPHDGCSTLTATVFDSTVTDEKDKITVNKNSVVALTDKRDNMVYAVARLADGNCWMMENLRLDNQYTMGQNQNDSSVTNQYLSQGYGGMSDKYGNFVGLATSESARFNNVTTPNSVYESSSSVTLDVYDPLNNRLEDIGTSDNPEYRFPRYNNSNTAPHDDNNPDTTMLDGSTFVQDYTNSSSPTTSGTYSDGNVYSYGNYYTFAAAIANTNKKGTSNSIESVGTSICPASWHLPSGNSIDKEFSVLSIQYGGTGSHQTASNSGGIMSNRFRTFPNDYLYSGLFSYGTAPGYRGTSGDYWSRSGNVNSNRASSLSLESGMLYVGDNYAITYLYQASTVRCLIGATDVEVTLDSNNGTGAVSRLYGLPEASISLPSSAFAQPGYVFKNWNTAPDGSGTTYTSSFTIPAGSTGETLYAQWTKRYYIKYINNCMTYASSNESCTQEVSEGASFQNITLDSSGNGSGTLAAYNKWTLTGWKIKEWTTNADGTGTAYPVKSTYSVTGANPGDSITLYAHWVPLYSIQYDGNGASNVNGMGTLDSTTGNKSVQHINVGQGDEVKLLASNFIRSGYGFVGWSTDASAWSHFTDNNSSNDPVIYGPNEMISAPAYPNNGTNIVTLYAVWIPAATSGGSPVYFQGWNGCQSLTSTIFDSNTGAITASKNSIIALTDKRDNMVYAVARLADGNCWMIENLRLEYDATVGQNINNPNVTNESLSQGYKKYSGSGVNYGDFVGLAEPEVGNFSTDSTVANSLYYSGTQSGTASMDINTGGYPGARLPRYNNSNTHDLIDSTSYIQDLMDASNPTITGTNYSYSNLYSYGNYYNWAAANATTSYISSQTATTSICPSGWKVPYGYGGASDTDMYIIAQSYGGTGRQQTTEANGSKTMTNRFLSFPNNFVRSGSYGGSSFSNRGSAAIYISSRANAAPELTYQFFLSDAVFDPATSGVDKSMGRPLRCLIAP